MGTGKESGEPGAIWPIAGDDWERWPILPERPTCAEIRFRNIAEAAYFLAEKRGFAPGKQLDDWLAAEIAIDQHSLAR